MPKRNFNTNLTKQERERIGELVRALRNDSGISQKELAFKSWRFSCPDYPDREGNVRLSSRHANSYPGLLWPENKFYLTNT